MPEMAERLQRELRAAGMPSFFDDSGSIGRRYRRQDEAGTPFGITVDGQAVADGTVTIRHRDTLRQDRIDGAQVVSYVRDLIR
jgi:glycyl-tRNA synthetase